ncbi:MAG: ribulose-phosphate 3-epimerase [Chitinophagaceae bacterium]|nr:MAG: ribulose-phosphate 3-epimerase [Chitinophagaceae bacterium]
MALIAPSLLAADFLHLDEVCRMINSSVADRLHLDVMDGRFVPNISFGIPVIQQVTKVNKKTSEVHLMIVEPDRYIKAFHDAGADTLIIHLEACIHLNRNIQEIKSLGMKAGVAVNPHTPVSLLTDILEDIDLVCMMSVNPGFGGQRFIPGTLKKITGLRRMINERNLQVDIEIDGGVDLSNAQSIIDAGANTLVAGSTVFNAKDPADMILQLSRVI